jgi:hypothetical protein
MQKLILKIIVFSTFIIVSASCYSLPIPTPTFAPVPEELTDQSILTNNPCTAPCWNNLIPDQSSTQDALELLTTIPFIDSENIIIRSSSWWPSSENEDHIPAILIRGLCAQPARTVCVEILVVEDKVKEISLFPNYKLTLEGIVGNLGEPDYMVSNPWGVECLGCTIRLFWPEFSANITSHDTRCVEGAKLCEKIYDGGKVPLGFIVAEITYIGSVPSYVEDWYEDARMPWPGFESP